MNPKVQLPLRFSMSAESRVAAAHREREWRWCLDALAALNEPLKKNSQVLERMALALRLLNTAQGRPLLAREVVSHGFISRTAKLLLRPLPRELLLEPTQKPTEDQRTMEREAERDDVDKQGRLLREHLQRRVALASGVAGMIGADTEDQHTQETALDAFMEVRER